MLKWLALCFPVALAEPEASCMLQAKRQNLYPSWELFFSNLCLYKTLNPKP